MPSVKEKEKIVVCEFYASRFYTTNFSLDSKRFSDKITPPKERSDINNRKVPLKYGEYIQNGKNFTVLSVFGG
jgi:hypothetical protein